jgi:protein involved in polysaccharide export with SLBB domain
MNLHSIAAAGALALSALAPIRSSAQVPTQGQTQLPGGLPAGLTPDQLARLLQQNPQLGSQIQQRLQQSGLTPDQVRAQLAAAGYPPNLLDAFLGTPQAGQPTPLPTIQTLAAIQALGLGTVGQDSEALHVDTGFVRARAEALHAESLATGNYVFGTEVFRRTTTQFLPTLAGPVPPDYRLGPGDHLVLILTGDVQRAHTLQVTREGFVLIPQVGQVFVSNLTLDQLRDVLYSRLRSVYSGVKRGPDATTRFDVSVANVRVNQVYVIGEVKQPGAYQLSALGTALTALYAAGGVTARGNTRDVEIRRQDALAATFDLYDYLLRGVTRGNVRLETGDVVYVPLHGTRVRVTGAVQRPAIYELKEGETLPDLLRSAGGFRANAAVDRLTIHRILPAAQRRPGPLPRAALDVALAVAAPSDRGGSVQPGQAATAPGADADPLGGVVIPSLPLDNGDSVVVDSIGPLESLLYVGINGMVNKPGRYPWQERMTLRDLVKLARGPKIGAYLKDVEIARLPADRTQGQLADTLRAPIDSTYLFERDAAGHYIGPVGQAFAGSGAPEVTLQPYDEVLILKQPDFELQRTVQVRGEVRFPGTYALRSKTDRLTDVLDRAGGLTPQAYPNGIRFYRREANAGRVGLDLAKVLKDKRYRDNMLLADGDSLYIPPYLPTVRVEGAVNSPGSVTYSQGQGLDYYLSAAGGVSFRGDKGRVFVQQPNGNVRAVHKRPLFFGTSKPTPEPGAMVVVPLRDTTSQSNTAAVLAAIGTIVASLVTVAVVVVNHP